jgi:hypothetical protein
VQRKLPDTWGSRGPGFKSRQPDANEQVNGGALFPSVGQLPLFVTKTRPWGGGVPAERWIGDHRLPSEAVIHNGSELSLEYGTLEPDARPTWHVRLVRDGQPERILAWDRRPVEVTVADLTHWLEEFLEPELAATMALNASMANHDLFVSSPR